MPARCYRVAWSKVWDHFLSWPKVHPCRPPTAHQEAARPLSGSCASPSNRCGQSHRPTEWTSPCHSPTGARRRSDTAGPGGGVYWRLVSSCWGSGTCSPHCREKHSDRSDETDRCLSGSYYYISVDFFILFWTHSAPDTPKPTEKRCPPSWTDECSGGFKDYFEMPCSLYQDDKNRDHGQNRKRRRKPQTSLKCCNLTPQSSAT